MTVAVAGPVAVYGATGHTGYSQGVARVGLPDEYFTDGPLGPRQGQTTAMGEFKITVVSRQYQKEGVAEGHAGRRGGGDDDGRWRQVGRVRNCRTAARGARAEEARRSVP